MVNDQSVKTSLAFLEDELVLSILEESDLKNFQKYTV